MSAHDPTAPRAPTPRQFVQEFSILLALSLLIGGPAFARAMMGKSPTTDSLLDPASGLSGAKIQEVRQKARASLDEHAVVSAEAGLYQVPVRDAMGRLARDPTLLGPLAIVEQPGGGDGAVAGAPTGAGGKGLELFNAKGCMACHSLDGSKRVGPSFKGLFGKDEPLADGTTAKVDDAYLKESILDPNARIVQGFPPAMPPFRGQLSDEELTALVEFVKAVK